VNVNSIYPSQDRKRWLALLNINDEISESTKYFYEKNFVQLMSCQFLQMVSACGMYLDKVLEITFQVKSIRAINQKIVKRGAAEGSKRELGPPHEKPRSIKKSQGKGNIVLTIKKGVRLTGLVTSCILKGGGG
jgi:hypothetical protein